MSLSNAFSAGIFLSAAIVHIIPDSLEQFDGATKDKNGNLKDGILKFPYIQTTICMSFLFMLLIDRVIFNSHSHEHDQNNCHEVELQESKFGQEKDKEVNPNQYCFFYIIGTYK